LGQHKSLKIAEVTLFVWFLTSPPPAQVDNFRQILINFVIFANLIWPESAVALLYAF